MDFPQIRRKAKERAASARTGAAGGERRTTPVPVPRRGKPSRRPRRKPAGAEDPVVTESDVVEGALIAEMQGRSEPPPRPAPGRVPPPVPGEGNFFIAARGTSGGSGAGSAAPCSPAVPAPAGQAAPRPAAAARPVDPLADFFFDVHEAPAATGSAAGESAETYSLREYLAFRLGSEEYALEIEVVREILKAPAITEVPRSPQHVLGVILVRGQVVPVFDPRRLLGLPAPGGGPGTRVVVCDAGDGPVGLLVDRVTQVLRLPAQAFEPRPQGIAGIDSEYMIGVGREGDRLFVLLDAAALLARQRPGAESE